MCSNPVAPGEGPHSVWRRPEAAGLRPDLSPGQGLPGNRSLSVALRRSDPSAEEEGSEEEVTNDTVWPHDSTSQAGCRGDFRRFRHALLSRDAEDDEDDRCGVEQHRWAHCNLSLTI